MQRTIVEEDTRSPSSDKPKSVSDAEFSPKLLHTERYKKPMKMCRITYITMLLYCSPLCSLRGSTGHYKTSAGHLRRAAFACWTTSVRCGDGRTDCRRYAAANRQQLVGAKMEKGCFEGMRRAPRGTRTLIPGVLLCSANSTTESGAAPWAAPVISFIPPCHISMGAQTILGCGGLFWRGLTYGPFQGARAQEGCACSRPPPLLPQNWPIHRPITGRRITQHLPSPTESPPNVQRSTQKRTGNSQTSTH